MTLITLVRHGQTDWNLAKRIQGSTDIPLNDTGRADARNAAELLADGTHHAIYASPLMRAKQTADIISASLGLNAPMLVPDVREREFGVAEGMLGADFIAAYGGWDNPVPGAETLAEVATRAFAAIDAISLAARRRSTPLAESVIVVTHGGVIRALIDRVSAGTLPGEKEPIRNGDVFRFESSPGSLRYLETSVSAGA